MTQKHIPWYSSYECTLGQLNEVRTAFHLRCQALGQETMSLLRAFQRDLLSRAVHESNWQEGVELEYGRTKELAEVVMDDLRFPDDGRVDLESIADAHKAQIVKMKRDGATPQEIATISLARAHTLLRWINDELAFRQVASLAYALAQAEGTIAKLHRAKGDEMPAAIRRGFETLASLRRSSSGVYAPLQGSIATEGELLSRLLEGKFEALLRPMDVRYLHGLHRVAMMGVIPINQLGRWRRGMVHVGNDDLVFPPPEALESIMNEFCATFPPILDTPKYDPIRMAARVSYRFVRIHPYLDGNGRISRLLMNLVLCRHYPMVSLAPRAKERHRYRQAIRRADRGNIDPLACLIAIALRDTYNRMLDALVSGKSV